MGTIYSPPARSDELLRSRQRELDPLLFDMTYPDLPVREQKVRHLRHLIGFTGLQLAALKVEVLQPEQTRQILAGIIVSDLAIYRTELANVMRIDLEKAVAGTTPQPLGIAPALDHLTVAGGFLDRRYVSMEEDRLSTYSQASVTLSESRAQIRNMVLPQLHLAATGLALEFELGPVNLLHAQRLEELCTHRQVAPIMPGKTQGF